MGGAVPPPTGEAMAGGQAPPLPGSTTGGVDTSQNLLSILGIVSGVLGVFCCIFSIVGLVLGGVAYTRKEPLAMWAIIASAGGLVLSLFFNFVLSGGPSLFF